MVLPRIVLLLLLGKSSTGQIKMFRFADYCRCRVKGEYQLNELQKEYFRVIFGIMYFLYIGTIVFIVTCERYAPTFIVRQVRDVLILLLIGHWFSRSRRRSLHPNLANRRCSTTSLSYSKTPPAANLTYFDNFYETFLYAFSNLTKKF